MSFKLLPSTFTDSLTEIALGTGTIAAGHDVKDSAVGDRAPMVRSQAVATGNPVTLYQKNAAAASVDHAVITRADKLLTQATAKVEVLTNAADDTSYTAQTTYTPLASTDLVGPQDQDLVTNFGAVSARRVGLRVTPRTIPQPTLWLDAEAGVTADANNLVSAWADQSGNGNSFAQASGSSKFRLSRSDNIENRTLQSETFTSAEWDKGSYPCTVVSNTITATAGNARHGIFSGGTREANAPGQTIREYFEIEFGNNRYVVIGDQGDSPWHVATFDFQTGTVTNTANCTAGTPVNISGNRWGITLTIPWIALGYCSPGIWLAVGASNSSPPSFNAAGTETVNVYKVQTQDALADTTYIATTTAAQLRSVNSRAALHADGANDYMTSSATLDSIFAAGAKTLFAVVRPATTSGTQYVYGQATLDRSFLYAASGAAKFYNRDAGGSDYTGAISWTAGAVVVAACRHDSGRIYLDINGSSASDEASGDTTNLEYTLRLGTHDSLDSFFAGDICEIVAFDTALSAADRATVTEYLNARWRSGYSTTMTDLLWTTEAAQFGKVYFSSGFDFGVQPEPGAAWTKEEALLTPIKTQYQPCPTEAKITLTFRNVTRAKAEEFKALPGLTTRPMFLYDPDAYLWAHKLEHVLVETWTETIEETNSHIIELTCRRLKHYQ